MCIQNAPSDFRDALRCACIAEVSVTADPTAELLEKVLSSTATNALKQDAALKQLTAKQSALSSNSPAVQLLTQSLSIGSRI